MKFICSAATAMTAWLLLASWGVAQPSVVELQQETVQQAVAAADASVVRIETVGGFDLVGELLTGAGPTTGLVVRPDGYIITSQFNFLSKPSSILVTLPDDRRFPATIVAQDDSRMLTLLKIDATGLPTLSAVPNDEIRVGQTAIALGRTYALEFPNVAVGIISALNRVWGRALQTDAHTSPVNYGGPLLDLSGRCLGVIVPLSPDEQTETAGVEWYDSGIGFAVPLADIEAVLDRLIEGETLKRGLLGGSFEDKGVLSGEAKLIRVRPDSPLDKADIQPDDIIVGIDGETITRVNDLKHALGRRYAGDDVKLAIKRGDETLEKQVTLTDELKIFKFPYLGILPESLTPDDASVDGVRVRAVFPETPAATAEIRAGDILRKVGDSTVANEDELRQQLYRTEIGQEVSIELSRGMETITIQCDPVRYPDEIPESVPSLTIEPPDEEPTSATGRLNEQLPGDGLGFWAFVPPNYRPDQNWGLVVWLHPSGDTMEARTLRQWTDYCEQHGLILLGPRAGDVSGWSLDQSAAVVATIEWMQERYSIDSRRVAVIGFEDSTKLAAQLAFRNRELIRGLVLHSSPLAVPPPDNDPDFPLQIVVAAPEAGETIGGRDRIGATVDFLREAGFPTARLTPPKSDEAEGLDDETVHQLVLWVDSLNRI
ncbi:MAG: PDZ domain-containing protein [Planctomycetaceae bacterium]|nr:PDZ domain-containing protein [Planctomycetaceae bacterium]